MKLTTSRVTPAMKRIGVLAIFGIILLSALCSAAELSYASWTQAELVQRARAGVLLEYMAGRIRANGANGEEYVSADIGRGPAQSCDSQTSVAALDLCEWANLLRSAAESQGEESAAELNGARGCISSPSPSVYVISIAWDGAVLTTPPGASCDLRRSRTGNPRRALLTVVRVTQDS